MDVEINELYAAVREKMEIQSLLTKEDYYEAINEVLEEFQNEGLITDDDNTPEIREQLRRKWREVEESEGGDGEKEKLSKADEDTLDEFIREG